MIKFIKNLQLQSIYSIYRTHTEKKSLVFSHLKRKSRTEQYNNKIR